MAKFKTKVCLVNMYGEVVCELETDGCYYKFPVDADFVQNPLLDIGDEYKVMEVEMEVE